MKKFIKGILFSLIPIIIATVGILIVSFSDKPVVKYQSEIIKPGYQTEPAKYIVEASYAKYWHDSRIPLLIVLAYVIFLAGTVFVIKAVQEKDMSSKAGNYTLGVVWLVGYLLIFIPMSFKYGSSSYQSTLTVQQYEDNKSNLDNLFPSTEGVPK